VAPELSVVIATSGRDSLRTALARLRHPGAEVIVVGGVDCAPGLVEGIVADAAPPGTRVLPSEYLGPTGKRELGWRAAGAPLVCFIDDDVLADPGLLDAHLAVHRAHPDPELAVLGRVRWAREIHVTPFMRWLERGPLFDYAALDAAYAAGVTDAGWGRFCTANISLKRELLERVGGFDTEHFDFLYEDVDLGKRLHEQAGLQLRYHPAASAEHLSRPDLPGWTARMAVLADAERRYVRCHPDQPPFFHDFFLRAAARPPARGRGARLARLVPRETPWLGPQVWASAEAVWAQTLGAAFLQAWRAAEADAGPTNE
jgi:hypothetical protein